MFGSSDANSPVKGSGNPLKLQTQVFMLMLVLTFSAAVLIGCNNSKEPIIPPETSNEKPAENGSAEYPGGENTQAGLTPIDTPIDTSIDTILDRSLMTPKDLSSLPVIDNPQILKTIVRNPLEILTENVEIQGVSWKNTIQIRGLKDVQVQDKINSRLRDFYTALEKSDVPPYRGIYQRVPPGSQPTNLSLHASAAYNFENLLSVYIFADKNYAFGERVEYIGRVEALNFDLRTGEEITLPELFAKPSDAMTLVNDQVLSLLLSQRADEDPDLGMGLWGTPKLASPFKGLSANQKFYLSEAGIMLIFDHNTPAFDITLYPGQLLLPYRLFSGEIAIRERFSNGPALSQNLYVSTEAPDRQFVVNYEMDARLIAVKNESGESGRIRTYLNYRYPKDLPAPLLTMVEQLIKNSVDKMKNLSKTHQTDPAQEPYCETMINVNQTGPFYTLRHTVYAYGIKDLTQSFELSTFSSDGKKMALADCFLPNFNYQQAIYSAYERQAKEYGFRTESRDQLFKNLSFALGQSGLEFYFPSATDNNYFFIAYSDLGSQNLTIFD
jgi:hypothetical protein